MSRARMMAALGLENGFVRLRYFQNQQAKHQFEWVRKLQKHRELGLSLNYVFLRQDPSKPPIVLLDRDNNPVFPDGRTGRYCENTLRTAMRPGGYIAISTTTCPDTQNQLANLSTMP